MSSYIEEKLFWLLPFYMAVAAYFYYEQVHRTMRTVAVSRFFNAKIYEVKNEILNITNLAFTALTALKIKYLMLVIQSKKSM